MTAQNINAVIALLAISTTIYMIRSEHADYIIDLLALALALLAPRQSYAIASVGVLVAIRHTGLAAGLAEYVPMWALRLLLPAAYHMSITQLESAQLESAYQERISAPAGNSGNTETTRPIAENSAETISPDPVELMARAVLAGEIGLTEASRLVSGSRSGRRYQKVSRQIKLEIQRQQNRYPAGSNLKRYE